MGPHYVSKLSYDGFNGGATGWPTSALLVQSPLLCFLCVDIIEWLRWHMRVCYLCVTNVTEFLGEKH